MPHQFVCRKKIPALITRPLRLICSTIFWAILVSVSALPMRSESEFSPACHSSTQTSRARRNVPCGLAGRTPAGDPAKYSSTNATHTLLCRAFQLFRPRARTHRAKPDYLTTTDLVAKRFTTTQTSHQ